MRIWTATTEWPVSLFRPDRAHPGAEIETSWISSKPSDRPKTGHDPGDRPNPFGFPNRQLEQNFWRLGSAIRLVKSAGL
jgi:hypothetical protein